MWEIYLTILIMRVVRVVHLSPLFILVNWYTHIMLVLALYLFSLIIVLSFTTCIFFIAQIKKDNSIIDVCYGLGFIITAIVLSIQRLQDAALSTTSLLILILILIWGTRLTTRIYLKNKGKEEDFRYKTWRLEWERKGHRYYLARAYLQIFILQGFIISIVLLPFTLSLAQYTSTGSFASIGLIIWIVGFLFETIGDSQLDSWIKNKSTHKGMIMTTGLWKYTRHPNYFGESSMWLGLACIALSSSLSYAVILSPLLITYLLLFVSGIPILEKKWKGVKEWEAYKKKTSAFLPLPPRQ